MTKIGKIKVTRKMIGKAIVKYSLYCIVPCFMVPAKAAEDGGVAQSAQQLQLKWVL